ncbi:MAG TPA: glycosyltransferase family 39 protein, partial [Blastocatellia bacterium]|nr:glycosyltransferase family 39 protein [Blastocatellia bacterium]
QRLYTLLALTLFAVIIFSFGLGRLALVGPDEPRYSEVAREMFATGDYISPRLCDCLWFEKPVLLYWLAAASYHLFGVSEFAARFPSVIAAILTMIFVYYGLKRAVCERVAFTASIAFVTSGLVIAYARVATPDILLTAAMSVALLSGYLAATASGRARTAHWILCFAAMGAAVLAKGLVGIALVVAIFAVYFAVMRQLQFIRWREALIGIAVFLIIAGTWYAPVTFRHGWGFIEEFFIRHHFQRYTSNEFGHPQPFYFFFVIAIAGSAPWSFFLIPAAARLKSLKPGSHRLDALLVFAWIWVAVPLLFFSASGSKLPGYILPIFPALAIIIGAELERFIKGERSGLLTAAVWLTALLLLTIGAGFVVYLTREQIGASGWHSIFFGLPLAFAAIAIAVLAKKRRQAFVMSAAGVMLSLVLGAATLLLPTLSDKLTLKSLSLEAAAALRPAERITFFIKKEFAPVFYAEGRVLCGGADSDILNALSEDILADALRNESSLIVITTSNWRKGLESDPRFATELLATQGDALAFRVWLTKY